MAVQSDVPHFHLGEERQYLKRTDWGRFPDVVILSEERFVKKHPLYASAKEGDPRTAEGLVDDVLTTDDLSQVQQIMGAARPFLLPVHALETEGMNVIPRVFARTLSRVFDLPVYSGVIQTNRVAHTGASGYHRLAFPAIFDGNVTPADYVLIDDFVGQGGTFANLKGFVESKGGKVVGAVALTGKSYSAKVRIEEQQLAELRTRHGKSLEEWWFTAFGYGFEKLTQSEGRYLSRVDHADEIRERLASARGRGDR